MTESPTTQQAPLARRRRRWPLIVLGIVLVMLLVAIGGPFGVYHFTRYVGVRQLQSVMAELDAADPNWRYEDLEKTRAVIRPDENSALQVEKIAKLIPEKWSDSNGNARPGASPPIISSDKVIPLDEFLKQLPPEVPKKQIGIGDILREVSPEVQLSEEQIEALRGQLRLVEQALPEARKLAEMPKGRYCLEWKLDALGPCTDPIDVMVPVARVLEYDALLRAQEGDIETACRDCRGMINAGRSVGDEPSTVSFLFRGGTVGDGVRSLERILAQGQAAGATLTSLQALLEMEDSELRALEVMVFRGQRASMHKIYEYMDAGQYPGGGSDPPRSNSFREMLGEWIWMATLPGSHAKGLERMTAGVDACSLPLAQQERQIKSLQIRRPSQTDTIPNLMLGVLSSVVKPFQAEHARLRCAIVALASERYRLSTNRWPDSMEALVTAGLLKEVPTDPYDDQPIRFKRAADGLILYSIGFLGKDHDGKLNRGKGDPHDTNVGFQLWAIEKRRQPPPKTEGSKEGNQSPARPH